MTYTRLSRLDPAERASLAKRNGYQAESFIGLDQIECVRKYANKSTKQSDTVLEWYSEERDVPPQRVIYPGMPVPEREYFKDFLRYYIATHGGLLRDPKTGERRPAPTTGAFEASTYQTIYTVFLWRSSRA